MAATSPARRTDGPQSGPPEPDSRYRMQLQGVWSLRTGWAARRRLRRRLEELARRRAAFDPLHLDAWLTRDWLGSGVATVDVTQRNLLLVGLGACEAVVQHAEIPAC